MTFKEALLRRRVQFKTSPGDPAKIHICCPFCTSRGRSQDTQFKLCVHSVQLWGKCVHCDWKRRVAVFTVLKQLGITETVSGVDFEEPAKPPEPVELPADYQILDRVYDDLDKQAQNYLLNRGITKEQITTYRIGVSYHGRYAYRIIFPVFVGNELKAVNARDFTGQSQIKYLNNRGDKYLFGFDPNAYECILSEGVFKALRIAQVTSSNSAAVLGHDLTDSQQQQIEASSIERIILYPDTDLTGRRGVIGISEKLLRIRKKI